MGHGPEKREGRGFIPALYRRALWILPPGVRREDGEEMAWTFRRLWTEARGGFRKTRLFARAFGHLPGVALVEWKEHYLGLPGRGGPGRPRRWGMASWMRNLRYALRTLKKTPSFALTTVLLLALGIGAVTTIFTLVDHVVLRPLPYPSADRLFLVENGSHSGPTVREFREMQSVERWGFVLQETSNLVGEGDPLRVLTMEVSRDFFSILGARTAAGRLFVEEDYRAPSVAVLSHGTWERVFGSDPGVVGRTVRIDGEPFTVVGVVDQDFLPPEAVVHRGQGADIWLPFDWSREALDKPGYHNIEAIGRMAEGATLADVGAEIDRALERLAHAYPDQFLDDEGNLHYDLPPAALQEITSRPVRTGLNLLLGAVSLLLLVACMNVAHLFLARGIGRVREMAVRRALGADVSSLVQQLLVESLVLGTAGGVLGLGLAALGLKTFLALNPTALPRSAALTLDVRILLFAVLVSTLTVLIFGLVPAMRSLGEDVVNDLKGASRSSTAGKGAARMRGGLVMAEVALSLMLVAAGGLLLRSFLQVQARETGVRTEGVWTVPLTPSWIDSPDEYVEAMSRVEASLASLPEVESATFSLTLPFEIVGRGRCCWSTNTVTVGGQEREGERYMLQPASESYFETLGIRLVAGRIWSSAESRVDPWPVVLSEALAMELWGSAERAVNRRLEVGGDRTEVQVYGVAEDTRHFGLDQDHPFFLYLPVEKIPFGIPLAHMAVRIEGDAPPGWARTLREAVWKEVPDMPVPTVRSMEEWVSLSMAGRRFDSVLFGAFGVLALLLAAAGLYGTLLYAVGQRRRELGIRMALGAARRKVQGKVVLQGFLLAAAGSALGLAGAWAAGRFLRSRLYQLSPADPLTLAGAVVVLLLVASLASWFPARRAARVDPMEVLRDE